MEAFILISLKNSDEEEVLDRLKENPKVKEAHILFGEWDIIAKLHIQNEQELGTFVMENIRALESVDLTSTLIVAK